MLFGLFFFIRRLHSDEAAKCHMYNYISSGARTCSPQCTREAALIVVVRATKFREHGAQRARGKQYSSHGPHDGPVHFFTSLFAAINSRLCGQLAINRCHGVNFKLVLPPSLHDQKSEISITRGQKKMPVPRRFPSFSRY